MKKKIKNPIIIIILLILSAVLYSFSGSGVATRYDDSSFLTVTSHINTSNIRYFDVSDTGLIACNERNGNRNFIFTATLPDQKIKWLGAKNPFMDYCGALSRYEVILNDAGEMYLHYVGWSENNSAIDREGILRVSADGRHIMDVGGIDYSSYEDKPTRVPRLCAFSYRDDSLHFCYLSRDTVSFYTIDRATDSMKLTGTYQAEEDSFAAKAFALENDYLLVTGDGAAYRVNDNGEVTEELYRSSTLLSDPEESDLIGAATELNGNIYVTAGYRKDTVYMLRDMNLEYVTDLNGLYCKDDDDLFWDLAYEIRQLKAAGDTLYINLGGQLLSWDGNDLNKLDPSYAMPAANTIVTLLPLVSLLLFIAGLILFIMLIVRIKKSLLVKQLILVIPLLSLTSLVICYIVSGSFIETYIETETDTVLGISEMTAGILDGDMLSEISAGDSWNTEQYESVRSEMLSLLQYNRGYWSGNYDMHVTFLSEEGYGMIFADTKEDIVPFSVADTYFYAEIFEEYAIGAGSDSSVFIFDLERSETINSIFDYGMDKIMVVTPIYDSEGNTPAYVITSTDDYALAIMQISIISILLGVLIPGLVVLLIAVVIVSVIVAGRIRKATEAVSKIADGDLAVRIDSNSQDELGEICRQVNTMASNLEEMFDEKDRNEQFYYKFVPEKFRELLGKEKITDLRLGDAQSREFTVLFCDIRSFSINSEMLTAKENFEFVNVIYGIAGPIIREYDGFVDKYIGDAVMALFESADAAIQAGIKMYHEIVLNPETAKKLHVQDINIGIGIHSGMARIGIVGEDERLSGTVISDTVNISSRLESLTKMYHTAMLVTKDTLDRMDDPDALSKRYLGMVQVAGVNDCNGLYEILDCLDDDERKKREENNADFREGVRLFHLGRREEAADQLQKIIDDNKADVVTEMYCDYIRSMSSVDKGNVFRFTKK